MRFISGLANCHLPGLYSFVISERVDAVHGMKRVFYTGDHCNMSLFQGADFRLKPHNHRQDLTLTRLFGTVSNVVFKEVSQASLTDDDFILWKYEYGDSALNGEGFSLSRMWRENLRMHNRPLLPCLPPQQLHWSVIHTVVAEPCSAWLVEEGMIAPPDTSRMWSVNHQLALSSNGLYQPMSDSVVALYEDIINLNIVKRGRK